VKFGTYEVFATQEEEGYSIENQAPGQRVTITPDNLWANVTIRLRAKGGILIGSVRDKSSGQPVNGISAQYMVIDGKDGGGGGFRRSDGEFRMTAPTECNLVVIVSAPGYKEWVYTDPSTPSLPVSRMSPGERKQLDIELEPLPDPAGQQRRLADDNQGAEQPR
jgi:hypothetical protein